MSKQSTIHNDRTERLAKTTMLSIYYTEKWVLVKHLGGLHRVTIHATASASLDMGCRCAIFFRTPLVFV